MNNSADQIIFQQKRQPENLESRYLKNIKSDSLNFFIHPFSLSTKSCFLIQTACSVPPFLEKSVLTTKSLDHSANLLNDNDASTKFS